MSDNRLFRNYSAGYLAEEEARLTRLIRDAREGLRMIRHEVKSREDEVHD
jgi:hypothetical protein